MNTKNYKFCFVIVLFLNAITSFAASITWTGGTSTDWFTGSNWSTGNVPGSSDDVFINNASLTNQPSMAGGNTTVNNLYLSAGTLFLGTNTLTVNGIASFTGGTLREGNINGNDFEMQNSTFIGLIIMYKNGGGDNDMYGGNTCYGPIAFVNNDDSRWRFAVSDNDDFIGIAHFDENGTGQTEPAYNFENSFTGDISSFSTNTVTFGAGNGKVVILDNTTIYGSPQFTRVRVNTIGQLNIQQSQSISELYMTSGTLDMSGNTLTVNKAYFEGGLVNDGVINVTDIETMEGAFFQGPLTIEKTGGSNDILYGGNTFTQNVTLINSSSAILRLANNVGDNYSGIIEFQENSSGDLQPAYNGSSLVSGDLSVLNSSNPVTFGSGSGIVVFNGNTFQNIIGTTSNPPIFGRLTVNTSGTVYLNGTKVHVLTSLSFTSGIILSSLNNEVIFLDNATHTGAKSTSHVNGPVIKIGNDAFTFPTGDGTYYAPIEITAPSNVNDQFTATYFKNPYSNISSLGTGLDHVSSWEYWILDRNSGSSNVNVRLYYNSGRSGTVNQQTDLRVARFDGSQWVNHGNGGTSGSNSDGNVISSSSISSFSPFTLGSSSTLNPLPVSLLNFNAIPVNNEVKVSWTTTSEINNDYFNVEKSLDGKNWTSIGRVEGAENSNILNNYLLVDVNPVIGIQYYRLKQVDLNGEFKYSSMIPVKFANDKVETVSIYPNPASSNISINLFDNESNDASITVCNAIGQVVYNANDINGSTIQIDINNFANGIYNIQIKQNGVVSTYKLLKN